MFMLCQTSVKMAVLLHTQASDRFHSLLTVDMYNRLTLILYCNSTNSAETGNNDKKHFVEGCACAGAALKMLVGF